MVQRARRIAGARDAPDGIRVRNGVCRHCSAQLSASSRSAPVQGVPGRLRRGLARDFQRKTAPLKGAPAALGRGAHERVVRDGARRSAPLHFWRQRIGGDAAVRTHRGATQTIRFLFSVERGQSNLLQSNLGEGALRGAVSPAIARSTPQSARTYASLSSKPFRYVNRKAEPASRGMRTSPSGKSSQRCHALNGQ